MRKILLAVLVLSSSLVAQSTPAAASKKPDKFAAVMAKLRDTWVQEFNAQHADKVAALYGQQAVLMRWDGTVHGYDSILAALGKSIRAGAHDYTVHSLRTEQSGNLGYDTGAYNVALEDRTIEGNYVLVVKKIRGRWLIVAHAHVPNPAVH